MQQEDTHQHSAKQLTPLFGKEMLTPLSDKHILLPDGSNHPNKLRIDVTQPAKANVLRLLKASGVAKTTDIASNMVLDGAFIIVVFESWTYDLIDFEFDGNLNLILDTSINNEFFGMRLLSREFSRAASNANELT